MDPGRHRSFQGQFKSLLSFTATLHLRICSSGCNEPLELVSEKKKTNEILKEQLNVKLHTVCD